MNKFQSPGDIAFNILGFPIYFYGLILALAIIVGVYTAYFLYKRYYDPQKAQCIFDISPYAIIFGIIGARLYYCLVNFQYYAVHPLEIFDIRQGGLSIHGMIIIGIQRARNPFPLSWHRFPKRAFLKLFSIFWNRSALSSMSFWKVPMKKPVADTTIFIGNISICRF